jgi:hypothetical protein
MNYWIQLKSFASFVEVDTELRENKVSFVKEEEGLKSVYEIKDIAKIPSLDGYELVVLTKSIDSIIFQLINDGKGTEFTVEISSFIGYGLGLQIVIPIANIKSILSLKSKDKWGMREWNTFWEAENP